MVRSALPSLPLDELDLLVIENVGNLVCPAEQYVVVLSYVSWTFQFRSCSALELLSPYPIGISESTLILIMLLSMVFFGIVF